MHITMLYFSYCWLFLCGIKLPSFHSLPFFFLFNLFFFPLFINPEGCSCTILVAFFSIRLWRTTWFFSSPCLSPYLRAHSQYSIQTSVSYEIYCRFLEIGVYLGTWKSQKTENDKLSAGSSHPSTEFSVRRAWRFGASEWQKTKALGELCLMKQQGNTCNESSGNCISSWVLVVIT